MLDFTSSLYLGFTHPSTALPGWHSFTSGVPAALCEPRAAGWLKQRLARLLRCQAATLAPSTLHIFTDLSLLLGYKGLLCLLEAGTYPIVGWSFERAACRGASVLSFRHHDPEDLLRTIRRQARRAMRILVISDGFCTDCGTAAPLQDYLAIVRAYGGRLLLDDSQGLGIFGDAPSTSDPYGVGGGGTPVLLGVGGQDVLIASSLAKAFGAPIAVLAGAQDFIAQYEAQSEIRVHASPLSIPALQAARAAMLLNDRFGDDRRRRLAMAVSYLRELLAEADFSVVPGIFPLQTVFPRASETTIDLYQRLKQSGVAAVLTKDRTSGHVRLRLVVAARHEIVDIRQVVTALSSPERIQLRGPMLKEKGLSGGIKRACPCMWT